jgi:hypothetical protein
MKSKLVILLLALLLVIAPAAAQNDDLTIEPVATEAATVEATQEAGGIVINVDAPATPAPATTENSTIMIVLALMNVGQMGIILAQAIMNNGSVSKKTIDTFFAGLKGLTKLTAWDGDEKLVEAGEKVTVALLGDRIVEDKPAPAGSPG